MKLDITGLSKGEVLAALYNNSKPLGMGYLHYTPGDMTKEQGEALIGTGKTFFDYLKGRVMKVRLDSDEIDSYMYDRYNGEGAMKKVIDGLRLNQNKVA